MVARGYRDYMMEDQIVSAIQVAWEPSSDQHIKQQAFEFVNQLRAEPTGWQPCIAIFTKRPPYSQVIRIFCLEIIGNAVQRGVVEQPGLDMIKQQLLTYLRHSYVPESESGHRDGPPVENKLAQLITIMFTLCYPSQWPTFFDDMLHLTGKNEATSLDLACTTEFYLRVLNSIHEEIGDQLLSRSRAEQDRANDLKDLIRQLDAQKIALSWQRILSQWCDSEMSIAELCLKAIGKWVSWMDISLVVNQQMLDLLLQQLARAQKTCPNGAEGKVRDAAVDVFTEIMTKKMKAADKVRMVDILNLERVVTQLIASPPLAEQRFSSQYDTDLAETVAKLVNVTVTDIVRILEAENQDSPVWQRTENLLRSFLPSLLRFFSDEYDEVCSTVIPAMNDVLSFFRKTATGLSPLERRRAMLLPILKAIFAKLRYDETASWGDEDEQNDEAEFQDLRKRLDTLQQTIAATDEQLYVDAVTGLVNQAFDGLHSQESSLNWRDLDLALHQIYVFGDLAVKSGGMYQKSKKPKSIVAEKLIQMMLRMVQADIKSFSHPATQLQYMEICVRYSPFFENHTQYIAPVLENFLQLVHHPVVKVKTRSWYLFQRFVRLLKSHIGSVAETVVQSLSDLLLVRAELSPEADENEMSSEDLDSSDEAIFNSQLYLFEAAGVVCSSSAVPLDKQAQFAQLIMRPLFLDMEQNLIGGASSDERSDERRVLQVHHDIMALGTLARGFSDWIPGSTSPGSPPVYEIQAAFARVSEATLIALESLKSSVNVRSAARFTFSRLVGVLGLHILPQLPRWIDGLLTESSSNDEVALFLRLLDQIIFGFKGDISGFLEGLFTKVLQRVISGLGHQSMGTDDEIQLAELKREYLNFLLVIFNNNLSSIIISSTNQPLFETVITTIEHFARDTEDFPTGKMAFQVLSKMCIVWGGEDIVTGAGLPNGTSRLPQSALPGFDRFMINRFSPLCWALPTNPSFNSKDAQGRQALGEAANLQKTIFAKTGQVYLSWLQDHELRTMGMDDSTIKEYLSQLATLNAKNFRTFFQEFVVETDEGDDGPGQDAEGSGDEKDEGSAVVGWVMWRRRRSRPVTRNWQRGVDKIWKNLEFALYTLTTQYHSPIKQTTRPGQPSQNRLPPKVPLRPLRSYTLRLSRLADQCEYQRRVLGSLVLQWSFKQAFAEHVLVLVRGRSSGTLLYESHGFKKSEKLRIERVFEGGEEMHGFMRKPGGGGGEVVERGEVTCGEV